MSRAVPLTDPTGAVRAWMCGVCLHVGSGGEYLARNADDSIVASSRYKAEKCCTCFICHAPNPRSETKHLAMIYCTACTAKNEAESVVRHAAFVARTDVCPTCCVDDSSEPSDECGNCGGSGRVPKKEQETTP